VAPITIVMALAAWRFLVRGNTSTRVAMLRGVFFFAAANILATYRWRATECLVLAGIFAAGLRCLLTAPSEEPAVVLVELREPELAAPAI